MVNLLIALVFSTALAAQLVDRDFLPRYYGLAGPEDPSLQRRQSCGSSSKVCGDGCIPSTYTCCEDDDGAGCRPGTRCFVDGLGTPGCCPIGDSCGLGGGISTNTISGDIPTLGPIDDGDSTLPTETSGGGGGLFTTPTDTATDTPSFLLPQPTKGSGAVGFRDQGSLAVCFAGVVGAAFVL